MRFVCPDGEAQYRPFVDDGFALLEAANHTLDWYEGPPADEDEWSRRLAGADGVLLLWRLPPGVLRRSSSLQVVSFAGTGAADYVDLGEARECAVTVCNVPEYGQNAVAEHTFALILAVARRIVPADRAVRRGQWGQADEGIELAGRRLGVVGTGRIGARVIEIGRSFGMTSIAWTRQPSPERAARLATTFLPLERVFSESDVVTVHLAHTPETHGLIDARLIDRLRKGAIFVNTARGALVDNNALASRLHDGSLAGVGLDVFAPEPPPHDHPLLGDDRVVWTPHLGFRTQEASAALIRRSIENLVAFAEGDLTNVVNHEAIPA